MCSQMDAEPGPPLNANVSARFAGSTFAGSVPSLVKATTKLFAFVFSVFASFVAG